MKKNILVIQTLLMLPLIISSPLLGGKKKKFQRRQAQKLNNQENKQPVTEKKIKQNHQTTSQEEFVQDQQPFTQAKIVHNNQPSMTSLLEELRKSTIFLKQSQLHISADETSQTINNNNSTNQQSTNLITSEIEIIDLPMPERSCVQQLESNNLWESVILPTEEKELSFFEKFNYYTSTASQILQRIIAELESGQFDAQYKTSFDRLEEAVVTATKNNDVKSLATIAALCHKKYPTSIRISEKVALPASELLKTHYTQELSLTDSALQSKHEAKVKQWNMETNACMAAIVNAINTYQQNIQNIYGNYDALLTQSTDSIKNLRRDVSTFSSLNKEIRANTADLLTKNQLKTPNNIHANTMVTAEKKLQSILQTINDTPTIKGAQTTPQYLERLTNK